MTVTRWIFSASAAATAALATVLAAEPAEQVPVLAASATEIVRWPAEEARQGVAADARYFYVNSNERIGKYDKRTGRRVAQWSGPKEQFPHMNSCTVDGKELVCAASNYPAVPMASVVEVFDTRTMGHVRSTPLVPLPGSLTWLDRRGRDWYGAIANYDGRGGEAGRDHRATRLIRFDAQFRPTASWLFPASVLERFEPMSNSGGSWGADGYLYVTGHDRPELYVLRLPDAGTTLELVATLGISARGQAIAWDRSQKRVLWSVDRQTMSVVASSVPAVAR